MALLQLQNPERFLIQDGAAACWGANQEWYPTTWQKKAGCGPTNCAQLLWYLAQSHQSCRPLCPHNATTRQGFLQLMQNIWPFVTPTNHGVNKTSLFTNGGLAYAHKQQTALAATTLEVPPWPRKRPTIQELCVFLQQTLGQNMPVAFLNLSNGSVANLDAWHWVTLIDFDDQTHQATMLDACQKHCINLELWLKTSKLGGGFAAFYPAG